MVDDGDSEAPLERRLREIREGDGPGLPLSFERLEARARDEFDAADYEYIAGGAGTGTTLESNERGFDRWAIVPRVLRDVADRDLSIELFGRRLESPFLTAPMALRLAHDDAEVATANAAASFGVPMTMNTGSGTSIEELAERAPNADRWFQLYVGPNREVARSLIERAEAADYRALLVTVDNPVPRWKPDELENADRATETPRPNFREDPVFRERFDGAPEDAPAESIDSPKNLYKDPRTTWESLDRLRDHTSLPFVLKGILHPSDAERAVERGVDGIVVSNHGGRQIDGAIAAIDALPSIVDAVDGEIPVLFDSGVRTGADAFKAIALGADAVLVGRPVLYGLAVDGRRGVRAVLGNLIAEFDSIVGLTGHAAVEEIDSSVLADVSAPGEVRF